MKRKLFPYRSIMMLSFLVCVDEAWIVLPKLLCFLLSHALDFVVVFAIELPLVLTTEIRPKQQVDHGGHGRHGHGDGMACHESRRVAVRVYLQMNTVSACAVSCSQMSCTILTKGAAIPAELPIVNCSPVATVLLP